jgi:Family of unknown function (DUF6448)
MPPHRDSLDGPVVTAARDALANDDVDLILPFVKKDGEPEVRAAFDLAVKARSQGPEARQVADRFFFETVVRVHRAGEGAPFGLKPAGLDVGPVIPVAEEAIASGSPVGLIDFLTAAVRTEVRARFDGMVDAKKRSSGDVDDERQYVEAMLGLEVWSHKLYGAVKAAPHSSHEHG